MDLNARVDLNCGRKDGRTDGRTENRTPISHLAKEAEKKITYLLYLEVYAFTLKSDLHILCRIKNSKKIEGILWHFCFEV